MIFPTKALPSVVGALQDLLQGEITWHSRAVLLPFLQYVSPNFWSLKALILVIRIFLYNHSFLISREQFLSLQEAVISCLFDQSTEVSWSIQFFFFLSSLATNWENDILFFKKVRELACSALTSLAMVADAAEHERLKQSFLAVLRDRPKGMP